LWKWFTVHLLKSGIDFSQSLLHGSFLISVGLNEMWLLFNNDFALLESGYFTLFWWLATFFNPLLSILTIIIIIIIIIYFGLFLSIINFFWSISETLQSHHEQAGPPVPVLRLRDDDGATSGTGNNLIYLTLPNLT